MRFLLAALVLATSACGSVTFRPYIGSDDGPLSEPFPGTGAVVDTDLPDGTTADPRLRQGCRSHAAPMGWIAVSYLQVDRGCPHDPDNQGYDGVLLERFADRPFSTVLIICADQPIPNGWIRASIDHEQACEGARVDPGEPLSKAIQRVR